MTPDENASPRADAGAGRVIRTLIGAAILIGSLCVAGLLLESAIALIGDARTSLSRAFDHISIRPPADPNAGWLYFLGGGYIAAVIAVDSILLILAPRDWNWAVIVCIMIASIAVPGLAAVHMHATYTSATGTYGLPETRRLACGTWLHPGLFTTAGWPAGTPCAAALATLSRWVLTLMAAAIAVPVAIIALLDSQRRARDEAESAATHPA